MRLLAATMLIVAALGAGAVAAPVKTPHIEVELVPQTTSAAPGSTIYVAFHEKIIPGWHTYWRNPGDAGQPPKLTWSLPSGWQAGEFVWPTPERDLTGPVMSYIFKGEVYLPVPITVPISAVPGQTAKLTAKAQWLICQEECIPESGTLTLDLPIASGLPQLNPQGGATISQVLAAAPKPAGVKATFSIADGEIRIGAAGAGIRGADVKGAYFYPYDGSIVDQSAAQKLVTGAEGLTFVLKPGPAIANNKIPTDISGVIALPGGAIEITAASGPLPAGTGDPKAATTNPVSTPSAGTAGKVSGSGGLNIVTAAGLAFLGGLILNLMPCVFPILSIKAAALARHAQVPEHARAEGVAFGIGVIATFLGLAALLLVARAAGSAVGWGFQLQSPSVVEVLALVMLLAALNLSGLFEIGLSVQGLGGGLATKGGPVGAFFTGVLAVVVAAPCTAPFMAPAIGWAATQSMVVALAVFLALGIGFAAPFTAISFVSGLVRRLPKPGAWMDVVKRALAFPMYAAAAWLAWVFALQTGVAALPFLFGAAILVAFAGWLWGLAQKGEKSRVPRFIAVACLVPVVLMGAAGARQKAIAAPQSSSGEAGTLAAETWSPERVAQLQKEGRPVLVDFTAAWCVTCQVNERTALATRSVADAFARTKAVYLKADWTNRDGRISQALTEQKRSGVPLYLVYGKGGPEPVVLPQLLTSGIVVDAIDKAAVG